MRTSALGRAAWTALCLLVWSCSNDEPEPVDDTCLTSNDCADGQICADSHCADPVADGGTGGTDACSEGLEPDPELEAGAGGEGPTPSQEICETQCEDAKSCPDADPQFDCKANCLRSVDQVRVAGCHDEWEMVIRCGEECGVCSLCTTQLSALHICFTEHCRHEPDSPICMDADEQQ